ncbi:melanoma-associated antigen 10-like [Erinaceus europaeus]|uniref:Melanoma-associated antigen 10-like n=1 Tax=Erinaceus europaeus TaxID=9365 RepID=A0ABM3WPI8_ERIEU|nr:melanoma-associated antigen 10-like [Erinaceus europaeus]
MAATPPTRSEQAPSPQEHEDPTAAPYQPLVEDPLHHEVAELMELLLSKYRAQVPVTKADLLNHCSAVGQEAFPVVFSQASEFMQLVFGIDVEETEPFSDSYVLNNTLDLTLNGILTPKQCLPKTGLLINILSVIFLNDNHTPEEDIWELMNAMGVYEGREHFLYGEPRELLTEVWVEERYLLYQQLSGSQPARYEFQWGPRAQAEVNKRKLLELLAQINDGMPCEFLAWYESVLRDDCRDRAQTRSAVRASGVAWPVGEPGPEMWSEMERWPVPVEDVGPVEDQGQCSGPGLGPASALHPPASPSQGESEQDSLRI